MNPTLTPETRTQKSWAASSPKSSSFSSSTPKISESSTGISSSKHLHLYINIEEFKNLIQETSKKSQLILESIVCEKLCGKTQMGFPKDRLEHDEAYNCWLVNVNNEMFNVSVDESKEPRHKEQRLMNLTDDTEFHMVNPNKKKVIEKDLLVNSNSCNNGANSSSVKVVSMDDKAMGTQSPKMPFHMNWIPKPQDEYKIVVNNVNQPFQHVWLQMSEDGSRFIHPLEKLSVFDFVDKNVSKTAPVPPPPVETTPLKLVQDVGDLKELVAKLHYANEFAVDLEHNQYRSFQGLTCLMQISTRTEDFIVDTLKLRVQIGPYLREIFKDPTKKKVMHGADKDILWLQRDFGIYVCNMFDTGQASRVLKMERNSLDYLLRYFCGVATNKEYQTADWRFRPLTDEMLRYARIDTHYLLHIYDLMKIKLLSLSMDPNHSDALLVEVYQRSYNVCMQLYEKDVLNEYSYLNIYGLHEADLNGQQLAIVAALCEWRDIVARAEDESTGYVLPNRILLEIAKKMPMTSEDLRGLLKFRQPHIDRYLTSIVSIIQQSMQNAAEFEGVARRLKEQHLEMEEVLNAQKMFEEASVLTGEVGAHSCSNVIANKFGKKAGSVLPGVDKNYQVGGSSANSGGNWNAVNRSGCTNTKPLQNWGENFQAQKNQSSGFRALPGNTAGNRKFDFDTKQQQIKSPSNFPFRSFSDKSQPLRMAMKEPANAQQTPTRREAYAKQSNLGHGVISPECGSGTAEKKWGNAIDREEKSVSLSKLPSSFQKCLQTSNNMKMTKQKEGGSNGPLEVAPFGYAAARKEVSLKEDKDNGKKVMLGNWSMKKSAGGCKDGAGEGNGLPQFDRWSRVWESKCHQGLGP